jgi:transcriptional regulator of arginine metabolism
MQKNRRQDALLNLISAERIASQTDLAKRLRSRNFDVTQASISRDLDELGIIKAAGIYTLPQKLRGDAAFGLSSLESAGESMIVAKCDSGLASAAAVRIDAARIIEIVGTIAGDDTIFIAVKDSKAQKTIIKKLWEMFDK